MTLVKPVSALLLPVVAGVSDVGFRAVELQPAIDRRDLAALELRERVVFKDDRPSLHPLRAEPRRRIGDIQGRPATESSCL